MLLDTHTHIDLYAENEEKALGEIEQYQIFSITNSMDPESYERNLEIARDRELILPIFGIHPLNAMKWVDRLSELDWMFDQSPIYGEIGLDTRFAEDDAQWHAQTTVFQYFLDKASQQDKVVIVHSKGSEQAVLNILEKHPLSKCIMHWYTGPLDLFRQLAYKGVHFTVGVEILFSDHIKDIAREVPLEQLLTETDNPLAKLTLPNIEAAPRNILDVVSELAAVKNTTVDRVIDTVFENIQRLASDSPHLCDLFPT